MGRRVIITGAAGFIGRVLCEHLASRGWDVWAGVRRDPDPMVRGVVKYVRLRLGGALPEKELREAEACVHLAWDQRARTLARGRATNVEGTRALVQAFAPAPGRPFLFVSSCSAHKGAQGIYGRTKLEAEALVLEAGGCVARPGLVIGHGGLFGRLALAAASWPMVPLVDGGGQLFQVIAVDDLAEGLLRVLEDAPRDVMILAGEERVALRALLEEAAAARGAKPRFVAVPSRLVAPVLRAAEALHLPLPVTSDNLRGLMDVPWQDPAASLEALGMGLKDAMEAVREMWA